MELNPPLGVSPNLGFGVEIRWAPGSNGTAGATVADAAETLLGPAPSDFAGEAPRELGAAG